MAFLRDAGDWLDERTGWRALLARWLDHPAVGGAGWAAALASSVATCFVVLALTGAALMTAYAPSPQTAWASVHYAQYVQDRGWIVRGLHYWAAQALLVLAALHILHAMTTASYRRPRELMWWLTLVVPALVVGEGITGGLLPWDQQGWWARVVEGNIVGLAPVAGLWLQQMMQGGAELGALGLTRAYTVHVLVLPALMGFVLWARHALAVRQGWTGAAVGAPGGGQPALGARDQHLQRFAFTSILAFGVVFALFALTGAMHGAPLDAPADPMSDYPARPEWFLLPLFQLRKFFHGAGEFWGTTLLPGVAVAVLALLPFWDRPPRSRPAALAPGFAVVVGVALLGWLAWHKDARDTQYQTQRAKAGARAVAAVKLAMHGVPPEGALAMMHRDPELRGAELFSQYCASCHVLGDLGDAKKSTAPKLDGWGTPEWIESMIHDPDAPAYFGRGPYNQQMPSVDVQPKTWPPTEVYYPMTKSLAERRAVALFLASEGDEPGDPPRALDGPTRALGEKIVSERCTTCHLYKGGGDDESTGSAPEIARYGSLAWTRAQVTNPATVATYREGALSPTLKKHMPRFDKDLSANDVDVVARWARAHARGLPHL